MPSWGSWSGDAADYQLIDATYDFNSIKPFIMSNDFYNHAAGSPTPFTEDVVKEKMFSTDKGICMWVIVPHDIQETIGYAVWSSYNIFCHQVSVWFFNRQHAFPLYSPLLAECLDTLNGMVWKNFPQAQHPKICITTRTPLPLIQDEEDVIFSLGYEPCETELYQPVKTRTGYVLFRNIYDLYHADIST